MHNYSVNLTWSDEDGGYIATIPEFDGLSAFGDTPEEALAEAKTALQGFVEVLEEAGQALPEPQRICPYSGQLRLRLPKSLHARLSEMARRENTSLNTLIVSLVSEGYGRKEAVVDLSAALGAAVWAEGSLSAEADTFSSILAEPEPSYESARVPTVRKIVSCRS
jgi:antitoxin HicB